MRNLSVKANGQIPDRVRVIPTYRASFKFELTFISMSSQPDTSIIITDHLRVLAKDALNKVKDAWSYLFICRHS